MQSYVLLTCASGSESDIIAKLKKIPEVKEINGIWGKYDIFLKIVTDYPQGIDKVISNIRSFSDITSTYTMHVLYGQGGSIDE